MTGSVNRIALKPYLEEIATSCAQLSHQELLDIILGLAKDEATSGRVAFLQNLRSFLPGKTMEKKITEDIHRILDDVQALKESISERIDAIENGDYEALDDWDDANWDDEPEYLSDGQSEDLIDLFEHAADLFLNNKMENSRLLYGALFGIKDAVDEYVLPELELDLREERARYARCIYETSDEQSRLDEVAAAMDIDASNRYDNGRIDTSYPLFQDVIDTREAAMQDLEPFFRVWKKRLLTKGIQGRPASLLAEAVYHLDGFEGIGQLARKWGNTQPYGYLLWLKSLKKENRIDDVIEVSREALSVLKAGRAREEISDFLIEAGESSGAKDQVLDGKQAKFVSHPCDENLLGLLNEAVSQDKRSGTLAYLLTFFAGQTGMGDDKKSLQLKCLLMDGRLDDAWAMVRGSRSLGWSYGLNTGLVFGAVASLLVDHTDKAGTIKRLLTEYAEKRSEYSYQISVTEENQGRYFYTEIVKGLKQAQFSAATRKSYNDWIFKAGRARVDDIVSNTHRGAYERAALALGALAEIAAANNELERAKTLIHEYCKEKYNRHSAFKREVKTMISRSRLLTEGGIAS